MINIFKKFFMESSSLVLKDLFLKIEGYPINLKIKDRDTIDPYLQSLKLGILKHWNRQHIKNFEESTKNGHSIDSYISNYLVHTIANEIESGYLHIYRGVLSPEGHQKMDLIEKIVTYEISTGTYTKEWAGINLIEPIKNNIKNVG